MKNHQFSNLDKELSAISFQREHDTSLKKIERQINILKTDLQHIENIIQRHYDKPVAVLDLKLFEMSENLQKLNQIKKGNISKSNAKYEYTMRELFEKEHPYEPRSDQWNIVCAF